MTRRTWLPIGLALSLLSAARPLVAQGAAASPSTPMGTVVAAPPAEPGKAAGREEVRGAVEIAAASAAEVAKVFGVSGSLRASLLPNSRPLEPALQSVLGVDPQRSRWVPVHGPVRKGLLGEPVSREALIAPDGAGMWRLEEEGKEPVDSSTALTFITVAPLSEKRDGYLNGYHIGTYPAEASGRSDVYAPPEGFIEVTPQSQEVAVSEHFTLRQFLTKDQFDVWPKYLALNLRLVDKLELVLQELNAMGVRALNLHVMSGFRTPQYNGPGGDGRATLSRHMYGDAADVWVDGDHDGYIDDLNGDGRHDIGDAQLLLRAVERVEQRYPELTGGAGLYQGNEHHGPYVHVDVRGTRARW